MNDPATTVRIVTVLKRKHSMSMLDMMLVGGVILLGVLLFARKKQRR